jgi:hypothetical protein
MAKAKLGRKVKGLNYGLESNVKKGKGVFDIKN